MCFSHLGCFRGGSLVTATDAKAGRPWVFLRFIFTWYVFIFSCMMINNMNRVDDSKPDYFSSDEHSAFVIVVLL
jgi:hypothetical protein